MIESTKVVEPATIAGRLAEEPSRPFNSDDYFAGLGAFLDTMQPSYVSLPMIRDTAVVLQNVEFLREPFLFPVRQLLWRRSCIAVVRLCPPVC
jgi:hypothetical protein